MILAQALALIFMVESNRGADPRTGDNGDAVGPFQIHQAVVDDVNRIIDQKKYTYADRGNFEKSREIAIIYLSYYCRPERLGREPTLEDYCRTWNGGPRGPWKKSTLAYMTAIKMRFAMLAENDALKKYVKI